MIKSIELQNFKCFENSPVFLYSSVNVFTGMNGRGKSTSLQALILLAQSLIENDSFEVLYLNGYYLDIGTYRDVKCSFSPRSENITIKLLCNFQGRDFMYEFTYGEDFDDSFKAKLIKESVVSEFENVNDNWLYSLLKKFLKTLHFVSADRIGPIKYIDKTSLGAKIDTGARGENTLKVLANSINLNNVNSKLYRGNDSQSILQQTTEWLSYILGGAKLTIKGNDNDSSILYALLNSRNDSYEYKPINVGFGYSYILPLIVSGLLANKSDVIIVENPEAHLHPRAQNRISEFYSRVAATGVQVCVETHSEHIIDGFRVNSLKPGIGITTSDVNFHYFNENFKYDFVKMDEKGKISNWPSGFFDQKDSDMSDLFKLSRQLNQ